MLMAFHATRLQCSILLVIAAIGTVLMRTPLLVRDPALPAAAPAISTLELPLTAAAVPRSEANRCITVFFEDDTFWERDFIFHQILGGFTNLTSVRWNHNNLANLPTTIIKGKKSVPAVLNDHDAMHRAGPCRKVFILHCRNNQHCPAVRALWAAVKPTLVFLLSDEFGLHKCYHDLSADTAQVVLRQYSVKKFGWQTYPNVHHVLSGTQGFDALDASELSNMKLPAERKYIWSFSGGRKHDRMKMVQVLKDALHPFRQEWHGLKPLQMIRELYLESMFVPVGRGGASLDCFRMYEASRAGAIPIIVGPQKEIEVTFSSYVGFEGRLPPCVFSESWEEAVVQVRGIVANATRLIELHREVLRFWSHSISVTRGIAEDALNA